MRNQVIKPIHPFPARMAPDLAIEELTKLPSGARVLDPMSGSGTVLRQASQLGHFAIGRDMDPLAVLMTKVWTTPLDVARLDRLMANVLKKVAALPAHVPLAWIDEDEETSQFVDYWFGKLQQSDLRRIAFILAELNNASRNRAPEIDALMIALSRIIITKDQGASLARDTSHSRPHRVTLSSRFDVLSAFGRSVKRIQKILLMAPPIGNVEVSRGDARALDIEHSSVDAVLTSPPYLNAIDYMRGHRMSLVWLGYKLAELRGIRSSSIGAERAPDSAATASLFANIRADMCDEAALSSRHLSMVVRYSEDLYRMMAEISRVLRPHGKAILVVGNSCLRGTFVKNAKGVISAGTMVGLKLIKEAERELPDRNRYMPMPAESDAPLGGRMRTESILTFTAASVY